VTKEHEVALVREWGTVPIEETIEKPPSESRTNITEGIGSRFHRPKERPILRAQISATIAKHSIFRAVTGVYDAIGIVGHCRCHHCSL
jgi:hypothetical protein